MEINLPLLANAGPFTTGSVNHEDNNYCVVFWGGEMDASATIELSRFDKAVSIKPSENDRGVE